MDGITHITTEAITTDIATKGITTGITIVGITIGTALGLSASMGVQDTIAIGKRNWPAWAIFDFEAIALPQLGLT